MPPRDRFNALAQALGLRVIDTSSDGWHRAFERPDGLLLWRIVGRGMLGIQTAILSHDGKRYIAHRPFYATTYDAALRKAAARRLPHPSTNE